MVANLRLTGAQTDPREESDIRVNTNNLNQIICASTKLGGAQPMSYSIDGGVTWSQASLTEVTGDARQGDPTIDWTSDGTAWTVTIGIDTASDLVCRTFKSVDQGATWSFDSTVATTQTAMDRQALWIDHGAASPHKDNMYLIWHNGAPCFVSVRAGPGGAWSAPLQISGAETTGTAIGSDIKTNAKGEVFAFWPDTVSQNLFVAKSIDGGGSFAKPVSIAVTNTGGFINVPAQNGRSCLIYLSGGAFLTPTNSYVYAIWHDLAGGAGCNSAANAPGGSVTSTCKTRIFFSRSTDGGVTWSTPVKINDQPTQAGQNPNDQFFARLAVDQVSGVLVVVYYDTINDPGRLKTNLWMQASTDHGATWSGAAQVANAQTDETVAGAQANFQYGDYIGLTGHEGNFFACWTDRRSGGVEEIWGAPIQTSSIAFVFGQSTYSVDQVAAGQIFGPAYWIQVSGFSNDQLGLHAVSDLSNNPSPVPTVSISLDPSLNPSLTPTQLAAISADLGSLTTAFGPLPIVETDSTFKQDPQTFLYPFQITCPNKAIFSPLGPDQTVALTLQASLGVGPITRTAAATLLLTSGENPRFDDLDPNHPADYPSWLSFDLRFFKMTVPSAGPVSTASRFNATMTRNRSDAPAFVAQVIANLTAGKGSAGSDTFDPGLTQDEDQSALEFLPQDNAGNFVFNFAVARVRLLGNTAGAQAKKVRVFFRLFQAQTTSSNFSPSTTYRFQSDGVLNGVTVPLLGIQNDANGNPEYVTVPCFATPRINLAGPADMKTQPEDTPNAYTIDVVPGVEVESFFGCYLDINQPDQKLFPATPPAGTPDGPFAAPLLSVSEVIARAPHQCLIAEIRYDDTPIPLGADSSTTDKLAQRNIAWIDGPNPGLAESRRMPHPIDIKASDPKSAIPDDLLIFWGDTPAGATATLYLPGVRARDILALASQAFKTHQLTEVDPHTLSCPVGGVTIIPLPKGVARTAGLLSVELPPGIRRGERFDVVVRQMTAAQATSRPPPPPPPTPKIAAPPAGAPRAAAGRAEAETPPVTFAWKRQTGAFQIAIVISTKERILLSEERLLAWLLWIRLSLPKTSRWWPVLDRYIRLVEGRVRGFGGDPGKIQPSPIGDVPGWPVGGKGGEGGRDHDHDHDREPVFEPLEGQHVTGKVGGVIYDRFGDFEGFILITERGHERAFHGREAEIEDLVHGAWLERAVITVVVDQRHGHWPKSIILRRAPGAWDD
jgi:hypothetical protein